jgi:dihydroorotate dehydrogenase (fumarate)
MMDLTTHYLGLQLKNPLVVSSSPLTESVESILRLEEVGAAAVVLPSIFEEQLSLEGNSLDRDITRGTESYAESLSYFPSYEDYRQGQDAYLGLLRRAKAQAGIPIIGSLNGATAGGWVRFAKEIEQAGADALELNTYSLVTDAAVTGSTVERAMVELVRQVGDNTKLPIAVKLSPHYTSFPNLARQLDEAGADALVLFNRFYQPDFDLEQMDVIPRLVLSRPDELMLRLHWVAILYGNLRPQLAVTGGVHSAHDVLKAVMAGAQVAMTASELLARGVDRLAIMRAEVMRWMEEHEYESIDQMRGSLSRRSVPDSSPFERGNYIKTLSSYTLRATVP